MNTSEYDTTLFNYASQTQQKLVSRWGVGKHVRISYEYMKKNIYLNYGERYEEITDQVTS